MPKIAPKITLTEKQKVVLTKLSTSRTLPKATICRAQIILYASHGMNNKDISSKVFLHRLNVAKWRRRWAEAQAALLEMEINGKDDSAYKEKMVALFTDLERAGAPVKFTAEQVCQIMSLACEKPKDFSSWTLTSIRLEVIKRGIVENISRSHIGRFLK